MGAGIAQVALIAGHPVFLFDVNAEAARSAVVAIGDSLQKLVAKGRMGAEAADAAVSRLSAVDSYVNFCNAGLVVEAVVERLDVKRGIFSELEKILPSDAILATNTSSLSITAIAAGLEQPGRVVGMHFFNPAPLMALVEVVSGIATHEDVAATVYATATAWGKRAVHTKSTPGFIVNRVARPFYAEGLRLLNEQASDVATLDAIARDAGGFRMGPFELMDLIGHDVNFAVTCSVFDAYFGDPRFTPSLIQQELVFAGRLGRKSGQGFYDYSDGAKQPKPCQFIDVNVTEFPVIAESTPFGLALIGRLSAAGRRVATRAVAGKGEVFGGDEFRVCITDGRTAAQRSHDEGGVPVVLLDLAMESRTCSRIALSASDNCKPEKVEFVAAVLQAAGIAASRIGDVPGMAVMRTVVMLANEAADAVNQGVCSAVDVDLAMTAGVNYPRGPLAWADEIGLSTVAEVLENLAKAYGEDRYRVSPLIRRLVANGRRFHN
jgi:3-hydroxybutyryl-CoA dehydrogenase